jgi:hypothetical protein
MTVEEPLLMNSRSAGFPTCCIADFQSAALGKGSRARFSGRSAEWNSAIQQVGNLRYHSPTRVHGFDARRPLRRILTPTLSLNRDCCGSQTRAPERAPVRCSRFMDPRCVQSWRSWLPMKPKRSLTPSLCPARSGAEGVRWMGEGVHGEGRGEGSFWLHRPTVNRHKAYGRSPRARRAFTSSITGSRSATLSMT